MKKRKHLKFGNIYFLQKLPLFLVLLFLFLVSWQRAWSDNPDYIFSISIFLFLVGIAVWIVWDKIKFEKINCPKCNRLIRKATVKHKSHAEQITYYCPKCDIEWETGLFRPDD